MMMRRSQANHQGTLHLPAEEQPAGMVVRREGAAEEEPENDPPRQQRRWGNSSNNRNPSNNNNSNNPQYHRGDSNTSLQLHPRSSGSARHITAARRRHSHNQTMGHTVTTAQHINASYYGMELQQQHETEQQQISQLTSHADRALTGVKVVTALALLGAAIVLSLGTFWYVRGQEEDDFQVAFDHAAAQLAQHFSGTLYQKLLAIDKLAIALTSHALQQHNETGHFFPNVTLPDFEVWGSSVRVAAHAIVIHWIPLVYDEDRAGWEAYALQHRHQIDEAYARDQILREQQDEQFRDFELEQDEDDEPDNRNNRNNTHSKRILQQQEQQDVNVLRDGSGYHLRIWTPSAGMAQDGTGPYLPLWQRSPINPRKQGMLNFDFAKAKVMRGMLPALLASKKVTLARADVPLAIGQANLASNLIRSQYRHVADEYAGDPITFLNYPVFDRLATPPRNDNDKHEATTTTIDDRRMVGLLATNVYWRLAFSRTLPPNMRGIVCILENSYNQSLVYRIDGPDARFVGQLNQDDDNTELAQLDYQRFQNMMVSININEHVRDQASPENRAYTTVPLNPDFGQYTLRLYPTGETKDAHVTNKPIVYAIAVACIFVFTSCLFLLYDFFSERRKNVLRNRALENAHLAAVTEREMNEYICHEMRNPLAAAVAACNFVKVKQEEQLEAKQLEQNSDKAIVPIAEAQHHRNSARYNSCGAEEHEDILKDVHIIHSSLEVMDSILVGLLDWHHAQRQLHDNNLGSRSPIDVAPENGSVMNDALSERAKGSFAPTNILNDIFQPISAMLNNSSKAKLVLSSRRLETIDSEEEEGSIDQDDLFQFLIDCPEDLEVSTDTMRLKQVVYNLAKNATQYVLKTEHPGGFVRLRAAVDYGRRELVDEPVDEEAPEMGTDGRVILFVEDSGQEVLPGSQGKMMLPGIGRRWSLTSATSNASNASRGGSRLRNRFGRTVSEETSHRSNRSNRSASQLSQLQETVLARRPAAGASLCLCKDLVALLGGHLWLDESYDSGLPGFPGARFVVQLNASPLPSAVDVDTMFDGVAHVEAKEDIIIFDASSNINPGTKPGEKDGFFDWKHPDTSTEASSADKESHSNKSSQSKASQEDVPAIEVLDVQKESPGSASRVAIATEPVVEPSMQTEDAKDLPKLTEEPLSLTAQQLGDVVSPPAVLSQKSLSEEDEDELPEGISVLFVDDDVILRKLFTRSLKRVAPPSWTIEQAGSGEDAIERILKEKQVFQLIFMDQYMPAPKGAAYQPLLGSETTRQLRSNGVDPKTTIICGLSANDVEKQFINSGASSFTRKPLPCKKDELKKLLGSLLRPTSS